MKTLFFDNDQNKILFPDPDTPGYKVGASKNRFSRNVPKRTEIKKLIFFFGFPVSSGKFDKQSFLPLVVTVSTKSVEKIII